MSWCPSSNIEKVQGKLAEHVNSVTPLTKVECRKPEVLAAVQE